MPSPPRSPRARRCRRREPACRGPGAVPRASVRIVGQDDVHAPSTTVPIRGAAGPRAATARRRSWARQARKAEDLGYSTLLMPDHFGDQLAPIPAMMAAADGDDVPARRRARLRQRLPPPAAVGQGGGDDRPALRRQARARPGRWVEAHRLRAVGMAYDPPAVRVERFEEGLAVITGLLEADGPFSFAGRHYTITEHTPFPRPVQRPRPPIIVGGGGRRVLSIAGPPCRHRQHQHRPPRPARRAPSPRPTPPRRPRARRSTGSARRPATVSTTSSSTPSSVRRDPDRRRPEGRRLDGTELRHRPEGRPPRPTGPRSGTLDEMVEELQWRREEFGITYYSIEADHWEALGPVVARAGGDMSR